MDSIAQKLILLPLVQKNRMCQWVVNICFVMTNLLMSSLCSRGMLDSPVILCKRPVPLIARTVHGHLLNLLIRPPALESVKDPAHTSP